MSLHIVLDSAPLSLLCMPARGEALQAARWSLDYLAAGHDIYVPHLSRMVAAADWINLTP